MEILRLRLGWLGKRLLRTSSASLPPAKRNTFCVTATRETKHLLHRRRPRNETSSESPQPAKRNTFCIAAVREAKHLSRRRRPQSEALSAPSPSAKRNAETGDRNRVDVLIRAPGRGNSVATSGLGWLGKGLLRTSSASLPPEAKHLPHRRRPRNGTLRRVTGTEWTFQSARART